MEGRILPSCAAALLAALLLPACQQGGNAGLRTYPDAVVNINQVDPAYRPFFTSQHGANYTLSDQRKAYLAAARTARTPVPKYAPRPATSSRSKSSSQKRAPSGKKASSRQSRGKARSSGRARPSSGASARRGSARKPQQKKKR